VTAKGAQRAGTPRKTRVEAVKELHRRRREAKVETRQPKLDKLCERVRQLERH
jgi:hypothetical protein